MNLSLPGFLRQRARYVLLDSSSTGQWEEWRNSLSLARLIRSKRVRLAVAAAISFLVLFFFVLPHMPDHSQRSSICPDHAAVTDWSQFAYSQYVTNPDYLCNSVMAFEALDRLGSKAARVLMYPSEWSTALNPADRTSQLLFKAKTWYKATLVPVQIQRVNTGDRTWAESFTKLLAFNQTQYKRVLNFDSDSIVLQHMDELFLLPRCPVALPRAYWIDPERHVLSSQLVLLEPSTFEFDRVMHAVQHKGEKDFDMEIVNKLYGDSAMILPHRPYNLLTGEFRASNHTAYLGNDLEKWDPDAALAEAKFLHFSDWPVPKPWIEMPDTLREEKQPKCELDERVGGEDCRARDTWLRLYDDFRRRRQDICGMLPLSLPGWLRRRHWSERGGRSAYEPVI